jgi:hypothetical protein
MIEAPISYAAGRICPKQNRLDLPMPFPQIAAFWPVPSGPPPILSRMGEPVVDPSEEFASFARGSLAPLVAVILRVVRDEALAYDLATEALAGARWRWESRSPGDDRFAWLIELGGAVLAEAAERRRVPSVERRRQTGEPPSLTLTVADQQEIARLAEAYLELTPAAYEAAARLARTSPPLHMLREIGLSGLVDAQPLPDRKRDRHES